MLLLITGRHFQTAVESVNEGSFKSVLIVDGNKVSEINAGQFYRSLSNNLKNRMLTTQHSNVSRYADGSTRATEYTTLINEMKVFEPANWDDEILYGEDEVTSLAKRLNVDIRSSIRGFREFKDSGGKQLNSQLKPLQAAISAIPVCTAECERGFSHMNLIATHTRNGLKIETISALLFVKLVGPPLLNFQPLSYVKSWLAGGHRDADDTKSRTRKMKDDHSSNYVQLWDVLNKDS